MVFDLVDSWKNQVIGGCTYHVSHPGGRSYDVFPINALEAESRRINRFRETDYTPGAIEYRATQNRTTSFNENIPNQEGSISYIQLVENPEFPYTLDLRWAKK